MHAFVAATKRRREAKECGGEGGKGDTKLSSPYDVSLVTRLRFLLCELRDVGLGEEEDNNDDFFFSIAHAQTLCVRHFGTRCKERTARCLHIRIY